MITITVMMLQLRYAQPCMNNLLKPEKTLVIYTFNRWSSQQVLSTQGSAHTGRQWLNWPVPCKVGPPLSEIRPVLFLYFSMIHLKYTLILHTITV